MIPVFLALTGLFTVECIFLGREAFRRDRTCTDWPLIILLFRILTISLTPALLAALSGDYSSYLFGYDLDVWCRGIWMDVVFFAIFLITVRHKARSAIMSRTAVFFREFPAPVGFMLAILTIGGVLYFALEGPWTSAGYEAAGMLVRTDLGSAAITVGGIQNTVYRIVIVPSLCILLFYFPKPPSPTVLLITPLLGIFFGLATLRAISSGARGTVLELALTVTACWFAAGRRVKPIALAIVTVGLLLLFSDAIKDYRQTAQSYVGLPLMKKVSLVIRDWDAAGGPVERDRWFSRTMSRLDSVQDGGILADRTDQTGDFAGFRPFEGSLLALIPRYFWHEKPEPMSDNGQITGLPWYRVMSLRGQPWNNGSVSVAGIAYWQFGWVGIILTAFIDGLFFSCLSAIARRGGSLGLFVFLAYGCLTHFRLTVGLDEMIYALVQIIVPILIIQSCNRLVCRVAINSTGFGPMQSPLAAQSVTWKNS